MIIQAPLLFMPMKFVKIKLNNKNVSELGISLFFARFLPLNNKGEGEPFTVGFKRDTLSKWRCFRAFHGIVAGIND